MLRRRGRLGAQPSPRHPRPLRLQRLARLRAGHSRLHPLGRQARPVPRAVLCPRGPRAVLLQVGTVLAPVAQL